MIKNPFGANHWLSNLIFVSYKKWKASRKSDGNFEIFQCAWIGSNIALFVVFYLKFARGDEWFYLRRYVGPYLGWISIACPIFEQSPKWALI